MIGDFYGPVCAGQGDPAMGYNPTLGAVGFNHLTNLSPSGEGRDVAGHFLGRARHSVRAVGAW